jgi:hypothetical protein
VGVDSPSQFQASVFAEALRTQKAFVSNGPIINVTAQKLDASDQPVGPKVETGGTLSIAAGDKVEVTIEAWGHEWLQLDRAELYSHAPGREAVDGASNGEWPEGRIFRKKDLDPNALPIEAVPGSTNLRRVHVLEKFVVTPGADTWFVGMVRGTAGRNMSPFHGARPLAYANAILIDADGSGAYDDFPLKPGQPLEVARPKVAPQPVVVPTARQFSEAVKKLLAHEHE